MSDFCCTIVFKTSRIVNGWSGALEYYYWTFQCMKEESFLRNIRYSYWNIFVLSNGDDTPEHLLVREQRSAHWNALVNNHFMKYYRSVRRIFHKCGRCALRCLNFDILAKIEYSCECWTHVCFFLNLSFLCGNINTLSIGITLI